MRASSSRTIGDFDYVIVGAGSAGCVLATGSPPTRKSGCCCSKQAARTTTSGSRSRLGCSTDRQSAHRLVLPDRAGTRVQRASNSVPRGRMLGGSSSINGMVYVRGQPRDYGVWRQLGNAGWAWDNVLPYFKKSEDFASGGDDLHGCDGELRVEDARVRWKSSTPATQPSRSAFPRPTTTTPATMRARLIQVTQRRGVRLSTATAFLKPPRNAPTCGC
jgi:choline dehydrogenase-like flavoprotein